MPNPAAAPAALAPDTTGILDEFQTDLVKFWHALPNKGFFLFALLAWVLMFQFLGNSVMGYVKTPSLFSWMLESYNSPNEVAENDRHGNFVPLVVLALFWLKRRELLALTLRVWMPGLLLLVGAMALHVLGYVAQQPRISIVALFGGIYALMGLTWGPQWLLRSFNPFFFFVFSIPLSDHAEFVTFPLRLLVSQLVDVIAHFGLGINVLRVGTALFNPTGDYQYEVAAACSGIRSFFAILLLATVFGFLTFRSPWKRLFMMAMSFPLAVIGNVLRMLCIVIAAEMGGQSAGNYVHEGGPFGIISLLPYVPAIFGLLYLGRLLEDRPAPKPAT